MTYSAFVTRGYQMNPKTEDLLPNGRQLRDGMVVLLEDWLLRSHDDGRRALANNRWCLVSDLDYGRDEILTFVATYVDGTKVLRRYNHSFAWYCKVDNEGQALLLTKDEFIKKEESAWVPRVRFAANYDMMGDMEGRDWACLVLTNAMERELIADYDILLSLRGYMGLQNVTFSFDVNMPGIDGFDGLLEKGQHIASDIVGESDVNVYGVSVLNLPHDGVGDEPEEQNDTTASNEALASLREKILAQAARCFSTAASQASWDGCPDENIEDPRPGKDLCYDDWSGRYFYGSLDFLEKSVLQFNDIIMEEGQGALNTFYDILGLTPMADDYGWSGEKISVIYGSTLSRSGTPCITMSFRPAPKPALGPQ